MQVGFGQPKKLNESSAVVSDCQNSQPVTDFPPRGWGTRIQSFPSVLNDFPSPFGTFLDDDNQGWPDAGPPPPPHLSKGSNSFGRDGGRRGRGYLRPHGGPLPPQEELFGVSKTNLEYDSSVLPNGMILKEEYFTNVKTVTPRGNKKFNTKVKQETPWSLCLPILTIVCLG